MDQDAKKQREKEKKKLKKISVEVEKMLSEDRYADCLSRIESIGGNALRNLKIYECAITSTVLTTRYADALALIANHNLHGHSNKSYSILVNEAVCNYYLSNFVEANVMLKDLLGHKDIDDIVRQICNSLIEDISKKEESVKQNVDELMHGTEAHKPSSSSTSKVESSSVATPESLEGIEAHKPSSSSTSKVDPPVVDVESTSVASSSSSSTSSTSKVDPPVVDVESTSVESSSGTVASSSQKTPSQSFQLSENVSFEMYEVDNQSYDCVMGIGPQRFQKTLIREMESVAGPTSVEDPFKMKGGSFLLKHQFTVYSSPLQSSFYVVERVDPIQVFFQKKLTEFNGENEEQWWEFIRKPFMTIFRGIVCGLFAIHSTNMTCGDLDYSMYVTDDGQGRIFYVRGKCFSKSRAQKDLDDLLSTMESVITLIKPRRGTTDTQAWRKEFVDSYKLPSELFHFFESLRDKKVAQNMIHTTCLIDHPSFWPLEHRILNDLFRAGSIVESMFTDNFQRCGDMYGWRSNVSNDLLLEAIYAFKGDVGYDFGSNDFIIHFILAVLNHVNDRAYVCDRGLNKLTPADIALRIESVCPTIYTALHNSMCVYANTLTASQCVEERKDLTQALKKCSSLRQ